LWKDKINYTQPVLNMQATVQTLYWDILVVYVTLSKSDFIEHNNLITFHMWI
jgi:hypothetical protein